MPASEDEDTSASGPPGEREGKAGEAAVGEPAGGDEVAGTDRPAAASRLGGSGALGEAPPSPLRRYGPLVAIVAVLALVVGITVVATGDDDEEVGDAVDVATGEFPDGVITYSLAEEQGIVDELDFGENCDHDRGQIAIPFFFAAECVAIDEDALDPDYDEADIRGVSEDSVTVVAWIPDTADPTVQFFQQGMGSTATEDDWRETYEGLVEIFEAYYDTYGRSIDLEFVQSSGPTLDGTVARADGREAVSRDPFVVVGGPLTANEWTQEMQAEDVFCIACAGTRDFSPTSFSIVPEAWQVSQHVTGYVSAKLVGERAEFAGDEALAEQERVFGVLRLATTPDGRADNDELIEMLSDEGVEVAESVVYDLDDLGRAQELGASTIASFQNAGVTSILTFGDPIMFPSFTAEATAQDYFPEWILPGMPLIDMNSFGREMDQQQWENAFGISYLPPSVPVERSAPYQLYEWYHGEPPPAAESLLLIYPQVVLAFTAMQYAGPDLNNENAIQGGYAFPATPRVVSQPSLYYGYDGAYAPHRQDPERPAHGGVEDMVELWWDPDAVISGESGDEPPGAYRYVNGGQRYHWDEYSEEIEVFDADNAVTDVTENISEEEATPDYPPPGG